MLRGFTWHAAYGSSATHMVTEEALAERRAALEGDPGTDNAVKVDMPQTPSMHQAQPVEQPEQPLETRVGNSCSCQKPRGTTALPILVACLLLSTVVTVAEQCSLAIQICTDMALSELLQCLCDCCCGLWCCCSWYREQSCSLHADQIKAAILYLLCDGDGIYGTSVYCTRQKLHQPK